MEKDNNQENMQRAGIESENDAAPQSSPDAPVTPPEAQKDPLPNTLQDDSSPTTAYGPLIAVIIIIVLLLVAGFYFFGERLSQRTPQADTQESTVNGEGDVQTQLLDQQSTSDEIAAIERDLENTSLDSIDQELNQIDRELQAQ